MRHKATNEVGARPRRLGVCEEIRTNRAFGWAKGTADCAAARIEVFLAYITCGPTSSSFDSIAVEFVVPCTAPFH